LVEGKLGFAEVRSGIWVSVFLAVGFGYLLTQVDEQVGSSSILLLILMGIFLGWDIRSLR